MGAFLPPAREAFRILPGLELLNRGKVRDTYLLPDSQHLLIVTSDGISIFDYVLDASVRHKGYVLNMISVFWFRMLESHGFRTHLVAAGKNIDAYLPEDLRNDPDLQARAMVVEKVTPLEYEFIYRNVLTGSSVKAYKQDGAVCGIPLPPGMQDSDLFGDPLFTPTTKAETGHDENVPAQEVIDKYPDAVTMGMSIFKLGTQWARQHGILMADTKFEFGWDTDGTLMIIDEVMSPDSSRFWEQAVWEVTQGQSKRKAPPSFDKQQVRDYGAQLGINDAKRSPENPDDRAWVWALKFPDDVLDSTTKRYRYILWRLSGHTVESFAQYVLGVSLPIQPKSVAIVFGSESDITDAVRDTIRTACLRHVESGELEVIAVHVISCHRNPDVLAEFAMKGCDGADVVICAGGKAFALPGVLDALIHQAGRGIPVIGVAFGTPGTENFEAARLSIKELPSQPVVLNEQTGEPYGGVDGLTQAIARVATGELPPPKTRKTAEAKLNISI
ncbi:MAG: phosphoribosylaminoimidazolesuccinocarboxamide synthase [Patescibacteria group bacterium]